MDRVQEPSLVYAEFQKTFVPSHNPLLSENKYLAVSINYARHTLNSNSHTKLDVERRNPTSVFFPRSTLMEDVDM